jgi:hypothetical protein
MDSLVIIIQDSKTVRRIILKVSEIRGQESGKSSGSWDRPQKCVFASCVLRGGMGGLMPRQQNKASCGGVRGIIITRQ